MNYLKSIKIELKEKTIEFIKAESIIISEDVIESETKQEINKAIDELGTPVFIKINNCAPSDANFLIHELKCFNVNDILTLLKGSEKVYNNIEYLLENKENVYLTIMPWYKIELQNEFRCFYLNNKLKAICQRNTEFYFDYSEEFLKTINEKINNYFETNKEDKLLSCNENELVIIDLLYVKENKFKVIDIITDTTRKAITTVYYQNDYFLLFDYEEIIADSENCLFKVIESEDEILYRENLNKYPIELLESNFDINELINKNSDT
jgi:hypothetical protein